MTSVVNRCIAWNKARYKQELDLELAVSLLAEELDETLHAPNIVELMDGVGDVVFVAIGVLWKVGLADSIINNILAYNSDDTLFVKNFSNCSTNELLRNIGYITQDLFEHDLDTSHAAIATYSALAAVTMSAALLKQKGLQQEFYAIVEAICDSNDTKAVPTSLVDSSIKANINKGSNFVPPTEALKAILAGYDIEAETTNTLQ